MSDVWDTMGRSYNVLQTIGRDGAQNRAARAYVDGNQAESRNALAGAGIDAVMGFDRNVEGIGDRATARSRQATADATALDERQSKAIVSAAQSLRYLPVEQRAAAYQSQVLPRLQSMNVGADILASITPEALTDANLDQIVALQGGEVNAPETFNTRDGVIERDPYTGAYRQGYAVTTDPLEAELMQARIEATRAQVGQREAAAARSAGGPAPRGGGSRSGGGSTQSSPSAARGSALPPGFTVRRP
jgi:hypothetical protein